jgi:hypothetical protein
MGTKCSFGNRDETGVEEVGKVMKNDEMSTKFLDIQL